MLLVALVLSVLPQSLPTAAEPRDLAAILRSDPERLGKILENGRAHRLQILVAEPTQKADGSLELRRSRLGEPKQYFYPASSIKLCGAVAALLEINARNRRDGTAYGLTSELTIHPRFPGDEVVGRDETNLEGARLTLAHDLRKLFLVSDNAAFNHCFEIVGQRGLNEAMWAGGFTSVRIWHRLSEPRSPAENRLTRTVRLRDGSLEATLAERDAGIDLANDLWTELDVGDGYLSSGKPVSGPMSFANKNAILLEDLQDLLVEIVRPEIDTKKRGFPDLTVEQRRFVVSALGEFPSESSNPKFDPTKVPDHGCKFVLPGVARVIPKQYLRIYDKIGRAYGFSIENAYIEDRRTGSGFFLAAVLYTNPDGILNDDAYAYEEIADPFFVALGETLTRAILTGTRPQERAPR